MQMSVSPSDALSKGSQFFALLQDGFDRMLAVVQSERFEFIVKGERFSSTLAEAVLLSPKVYEIFQVDPSIRTFTISEEDKSGEIETSSFKKFLECVHFRDFQQFSQSDELSFLSICRMLGNERLAFLFLASPNLQSSSTSISTSTSTSSNTNSISSDIMLSLISASEATIDYCASKFHCYSIDEIGRLDKQTLHHVLGSSSHRVESEDQLLHLHF
jgi:hypothetical protein